MEKIKVVKNNLLSAESLIVFGCIWLHYLMFDRYFLNGQATLSGDTQIYWSLEYLLFYSIKHFNEFLWWDPTGLNGYQAYLILLNNLNYLNIFEFLYLIIFKIFSLFSDFQINSWIIFQKTIYYFTVNLLLITLISKKLVKSIHAVAFITITFTLCQYQFLAMRDSYIVQQLPAGLLLLYGFIIFSKNCSKTNFIFLSITLAIFISSASYSMVLGPFYWLGTFLISYIIIYPKILRSILSLIFAKEDNNKWLFIKIFLGLLVLSAILFAISPIVMDRHNMLRVPGSGPFDFTQSEFWGAPSYGSPNFSSWSNLMSWTPFPDIHNSILKFDPWGAGLDHRYIGIATLPLIGLSFLFIGRSKFIAPLLVSFFICSFVIPYTFQNGIFSILMEKFFLFKNSRSMPGLLPRDGPSIFLILISGIALDQLINLSKLNRIKLYKSIIIIISFALLISILCLLSILIFDTINIRSSLTHIGVYLIIISLLLIYISNNNRRSKNIGCSLFLIIITCDLIISSSNYWNRRIVWNPTGAVPQHTYPNPLNESPLVNANWAGAYRGIFHNAYTGKPFYGKREWLVLALNPKISNLLTNWNPTTSTEKKIPSIKFYRGGIYQSFENINDQNNILTYKKKFGCILNKDKLIANGKEFSIQKGFSGFVESASNGPDIVNFYGWALNANNPVEGVAAFINNILWGDVAPITLHRSDIKTSNNNPYFTGFNFSTNLTAPIFNISERNSVKLFALLKNNEAVELNYSKGYPFNHDNFKPYNYNTDDCTMEDYVYVHDKKISLSETENLRLNPQYKIESQTFNNIKISVDMPQDGILVYEDNFHPLWVAKANGKTVEIMKANFTYKAISLKKGYNFVEFTFSPDLTKILFYIFYIFLLISFFIKSSFKDKAR